MNTDTEYGQNLDMETDNELQTVCMCTSLPGYLYMHRDLEYMLDSHY